MEDSSSNINLVSCGSFESGDQAGEDAGRGGEAPKYCDAKLGNSEIIARQNEEEKSGPPECEQPDAVVKNGVTFAFRGDNGKAAICEPTDPSEGGNEPGGGEAGEPLGGIKFGKVSDLEKVKADDQCGNQGGKNQRQV